jgi:hypothetical protein
MNEYAMEQRLARIETAIARLDSRIDSMDTRMNVTSEDLRQLNFDIACRRGRVKTLLWMLVPSAALLTSFVVELMFSNAPSQKSSEVAHESRRP